MYVCMVLLNTIYDVLFIYNSYHTCINSLHIGCTLNCMLMLLCRDRFRTAINVMGDSFGAGIVEHLSRNDLDEFDQLEDGEMNSITPAYEKNDIDNGLQNPGFVNGDTAGSRL